MRRFLFVAALILGASAARADDYDDTITVAQMRAQASSPHERELAQFDLAVRLHELGLKQASYGYFAAIARQPSHARHRETLPWLAVLALELGEAADVEESVGHYGEDALDAIGDEQTRWTLDYLLARYTYRNHRYDDALRLFAKVDRRSPLFARAQIQSGLAHVAMRRTTPALRSFSQVAR